MNLGELLDYANVLVPMAKSTKVSTSDKISILNQGALDMASRLELIKKDTKVDVSANESTYKPSIYIADFLRLSDSSIYFNYGSTSSPDWDDLDPYTREGLDRDFPSWRNDATGKPERYFFESNNIVLHPTPSSALSEGLWVYYIAKPETMVSNSDYPFGKTLDIPQYSILSDILIHFYRSRVLLSLGKNIEASEALKEYEAYLRAAKLEFRQRRDINTNRYTRMRGKRYP